MLSKERGDEPDDSIRMAGWGAKSRQSTRRNRLCALPNNWRPPNNSRENLPIGRSNRRVKCQFAGKDPTDIPWLER